MAYLPKTTSAPFERETWLASVEPGRQADAVTLLTLFAQVTGWEPRLWGTSIVGFGRYEYGSSGSRTLDAAATGFAVRRADLVLYVVPGCERYPEILGRVGPHRYGKSCLYLKRLDGIDQGALAELIRAGVADLAQLWPVHPA